MHVLYVWFPTGVDGSTLCIHAQKSPLGLENGASHLQIDLLGSEPRSPQAQHGLFSTRLQPLHVKHTCHFPRCSLLCNVGPVTQIFCKCLQSPCIHTCKKDSLTNHIQTSDLRISAHSTVLRSTSISAYLWLGSANHVSNGQACSLMDGYIVHSWIQTHAPFGPEP